MRTVKRKPTTPGEILSEEFLKPLGMTQKELADHIGCDITVINRIVNYRTSVTAKMAIKLAATFGTTPEFWLNTQQALNLYKASKEIKDIPKIFSRIPLLTDKDAALHQSENDVAQVLRRVYPPMLKHCPGQGSEAGRG